MAIGVKKDIYDQWMVGGEAYKIARALIAERIEQNPNFINFETNIVLVGHIQTEQGEVPVYLQGASDVVAISSTSKDVAAVIERGAPPGIGYCATIGGQLEKTDSGIKVEVNGFKELFEEVGLHKEDFQLVYAGKRRIVEGDMRIERRPDANTGIPPGALYLMVSTPIAIVTSKPFTRLTTENEADEGARRALQLGIKDLRDSQFGIGEHTRIIRECVTACGLGNLLHPKFGINPRFNVRRTKPTSIIPPLAVPGFIRRLITGTRPK